MDLWTYGYSFAYPRNYVIKKLMDAYRSAYGSLQFTEVEDTFYGLMNLILICGY